MMINFTLILLFNLIFIFSSGKLVSSSCMDKAVGERVEISLDIGELPEESELTWRHNQTRVYNKKGSKVKTRNLDVDRYGSLILENVQKNHSGVYEGKVYDKEGKLIKSSTHQLCVQEPVPKPTVMVEYATIANEETNSTKEENSNDENRNEDVSGEKLLFGLDFWWMLVILTGGASSLLVLFIICLVCVCRCHARNKRKATKEAEFRLVSLMPDCTDQPDVPYMQKTESNRPSKSVRPLPPLPSSRGPPPLQPQ